MTSNEAASAREIVEEQEPDKIELAENTPNRELPQSNEQPVVEIELNEVAQAKDAEDPKGQVESEGK